MIPFETKALVESIKGIENGSKMAAQQIADQDLMVTAYRKNMGDREKLEAAELESLKIKLMLRLLAGETAKEDPETAAAILTKELSAVRTCAGIVKKRSDMEVADGITKDVSARVTKEMARIFKKVLKDQKLDPKQIQAALQMVGEEMKKTEFSP